MWGPIENIAYRPCGVESGRALQFWGGESVGRPGTAASRIAWVLDGARRMRSDSANSVAGLACLISRNKRPANIELWNRKGMLWALCAHRAIERISGDAQSVGRHIRIAACAKCLRYRAKARLGRRRQIRARAASWPSGWAVGTHKCISLAWIGAAGKAVRREQSKERNASRLARSWESSVIAPGWALRVRGASRLAA